MGVVVNRSFSHCVLRFYDDGTERHAVCVINPGIINSHSIETCRAERLYFRSDFLQVPSNRFLALI
jgi:hypothetical protein